MKISWGIKIFILYGAFVAFVIVLVLFSMTMDVNLVADDYYEQEIIHQQHIDKIERTKNLNEQLSVRIITKEINFVFPKISPYNSIRGTIALYRPSDNSKDLLYNIILSDDFTQIIPIEELEKGLWKIKVDWIADSTEYYNEQIVMIN